MFKTVFRIIGLVVLAASFSCAPVTLIRFHVPAVVLADSVFEIVVEGTVSPAVGGAGAGCIIQLPFGFSIESALAFQQQGNGSVPILVQQNAPGVNILVSPEPGHFTTSFVAFSTNAPINGPTSLRVRIRAPRRIGPANVKIAPVTAISSIWSQVAPVFANFSGAPLATHVRALTVSADPANAPAWRNNTTGVNLFGSYDPVLTYENSYVVRVADVDSDGVQDLIYARGVLLTVPAVQYRPLTAINFGAYRESFTDSTEPNPASSVRYGIDVGDIDADGDIDVIASPFVHTNQGNGTFTFTTIPPAVAAVPEFTPTTSTVNDASMAMRDLNGDGRADLVLSREGISVLVSLGNGNFAPSSIGLPGLPFSTSGTADLSLHDMDNDGDLDIVGAYGSLLQVFRNLGGAVWATGPAFSIAPLELRRISIADLDGDGDQDVTAVVTTPAFSGYPFSGRVMILHQTPGGFAEFVLPPSSFLASPKYREVVAGDLNQDGLPELVVALSRNSLNTPFNGGLEVWENSTGAYFRDLTLESGLPAGATGDVSHLDLQDLDGDGVLDLIMNASARPAVYTRITPQKSAWFGNVERNGLNGPDAVLRVNGNEGLAPRFGVEIPANSPITLSLNPPAQGPGSGLFLVYAKIGDLSAADGVPSPIGFLPFLPSILAPGDPSHFLIANSFDPLDTSALLPGATPGLWSFTYTPGLPAMITISFGAIVSDLSSPTFGLSISNTVSIHTE